MYINFTHRFPYSWQWKYHGVQTEDDGVVITAGRISKLVHDEVKRRTGGEDRGKWFLAGKLVCMC